MPDKPSYRPGDVAKLDIRSKVLPATAVVIVRAPGRDRAEARRADASRRRSSSCRSRPAYIQNVHVVVDRSRSAALRSTAAATLPLPEHDARPSSILAGRRRERAARDATRARRRPLVEPGEDATFEVEVKHDGKPVAGAEVALIVVDEAVLALSRKSHADPLAPFYRDVDDGTWTASTLEHRRTTQATSSPASPGFDALQPRRSAHGGSGTVGYGSAAAGRHGATAAVAAAASASAIVKARKDFRANAVFSPRLDAPTRNGKVALTVKMPDSLTRFRVVALATASTRYFGKAESTIVTQRKVNARTVAPRFLTQGDTFSLPVVVQNLDTRAAHRSTSRCAPRTSSARARRASA